ncbi:hypothetical protein AB3S75_031400 [Citrus x aurantiifolia]
MMKNSKVKVILKWEPPTKVPELRSFLRLVNYYCPLHQGILGQGGTLDRSTQEEPNMALVRRVPTCIRKLEEDYLRGTRPHSSRPHKVIRSPNKCFRLAIGRVLIQKGHPIAFESLKLNNLKRRYTMQGKQMTACVTSGKTSLRAKQRGNAKKTYGNLRNTCKTTKHENVTRTLRV